MRNVVLVTQPRNGRHCISQSLCGYLKENPCNLVVVAHHPGSTFVCPSLSMKIIINDNPDTGTAYSALLGLDECKGEDTYLLLGSADIVELSPDMALLSEIRSDGLGVMTNNGKITHFAFGLPLRWDNILRLSGKGLSLFQKVAADPTNWKSLLHEVLNEMVELGYHLNFKMNLTL